MGLLWNNPVTNMTIKVEHIELQILGKSIKYVCDVY